MPQTRNLSPEQLRQLLQRLDEVMAEAERLRERIAKQLADERRQRVSPMVKPGKRR
jgi:hypothetical protein